MRKPARSLVWFRGKDLRISDHAPLRAGLHAGDLLCLFVVDPFFFAQKHAREHAHRMQFLLESIEALAANIERRGSNLFVVGGKSVEVVPRIAKDWKVDRVVAYRWTEPFGRLRDERIAAALDVPFELFEGETLAPPGTIRTGDGKPFSVFTPFARAHRKAMRIDDPVPAPRALQPPPLGVRDPRGCLPTLESLGIAANPRLPKGGEAAARRRLAKFFGDGAAAYESNRDRLDLDLTSRLSVDLKFGTLSVRTVWRAAEEALAIAHPEAWSRFSDELLWREFTHAVLFEDPLLLERPHRAAFQSFPWESDEPGWRAWCDGRTGFPVVDASARQLLAEGFVHNRARMISASFLTKDLLIDYRRGEAHYMKHLVDGDWAQNNFGWQWTAGCGFDAAPYFRVFNPTEQGKRFDPTGNYVRRWVPELASMPDAWIHEPERASEAVLRAAGVRLGATYPHPIVDHGDARTRYLGMMSELRAKADAPDL